jgi:hypothetical protein
LHLELLDFCGQNGAPLSGINPVLVGGMDLPKGKTLLARPKTSGEGNLRRVVTDRYCLMDARHTRSSFMHEADHDRLRGGTGSVACQSCGHGIPRIVTM